MNRDDDKPAETIKVSEAKQGEWYDESGTRLFAYKDGGVVTHSGITARDPCDGTGVNITHLSDCTGWDWEPEKPERLRIRRMHTAPATSTLAARLSWWRRLSGGLSSSTTVPCGLNSRSGNQENQHEEKMR